MFVLNPRHVDGIRIIQHIFKALGFNIIGHIVSFEKTAHIFFHLKGGRRSVDNFHPLKIPQEIAERPHGPPPFQVPAHENGFSVEAALVFEGLLQGENVQERLGGMLVASRSSVDDRNRPVGVGVEEPGGALGHVLSFVPHDDQVGVD